MRSTKVVSPFMSKTTSPTLCDCDVGASLVCILLIADSSNNSLMLPKPSERYTAFLKNVSTNFFSSARSSNALVIFSQAACTCGCRLLQFFRLHFLFVRGVIMRGESMEFDCWLMRGESMEFGCWLKTYASGAGVGGMNRPGYLSNVGVLRELWHVCGVHGESSTSWAVQSTAASGSETKPASVRSRGVFLKPSQVIGVTKARASVLTFDTASLPAVTD
mmetsp:Transcript_133616/g.245014  ORF Transcript_133616/g.245014 Transcript_133616/m.245014 type:complete len:219 (-) Transcript_133616:58-714(-)